MAAPSFDRPLNRRSMLPDAEKSSESGKSGFLSLNLVEGDARFTPIDDADISGEKMMRGSDIEEEEKRKRSSDDTSTGVSSSSKSSDETSTGASSSSVSRTESSKYGDGSTDAAASTSSRNASSSRNVSGNCTDAATDALSSASRNLSAKSGDAAMEALSFPSRNMSSKSSVEAEGALSFPPRNASSKSSDDIFSPAISVSSASDASTTKAKLSHSVSFSLKTNFDPKPFHKSERKNGTDGVIMKSSRNGGVEIKDGLSSVTHVYSSRLSDKKTDSSSVEKSENSDRPRKDNLIVPTSPTPRSSSGSSPKKGGDVGGENRGSGDGGVVAGVVTTSVVARSPSVTVANFIHCKLCLCDYPPREMVQLSNCRCLFCAECVSIYVTALINDGDVLRITCPDGECPADNREIESNQIRQFVDDDVVYANYIRFRTLREIENDPNGTWCPSVGCETICHVCRVDEVKSGKASPPQPITCPTCSLVFCSVCKSEWHPEGECHNPFLVSSSATNFGGGGKLRSQRAESVSTARSNNNNPSRRSGSIGGGGGNFFQNFLRRGPAAMEAPGADGALDSSPIKRCPICHILIEREEGCAQMMCKRCKHVFCWYCLESLDNDFLLRHYDRGPCKNKLGHSRASVIWHRTQVVGIFAGFGMLLLMASPFLLLAAPCILCCKCTCCHCPDIDDMEWYEGKGSPGTRQARQKRLAKSFGAALPPSELVDDDDDDDAKENEHDDFEDVSSFLPWETKLEDKASTELNETKPDLIATTETAMSTMATASTTLPMASLSVVDGKETEAETAVEPLDG